MIAAWVSWLDRTKMVVYHLFSLTIRIIEFTNNDWHDIWKWGNRRNQLSQPHAGNQSVYLNEKDKDMGWGQDKGDG